MKNLNSLVVSRPIKHDGKIAVVTGGAGFIGGAVVQMLDEDHTIDEIRILDIGFPDYAFSRKMRYYYCNVLDLARLIRLTDGADEWYDNVGLLGTGDTHELGAYPSSAVSVNVVGFQNQIDAAYLNAVPKFMHQTKNRFDEKDGTQFGLSENAYTATKSMAEIQAFWARKSRQQVITVVRYLNASSERQHLGSVRKLFPLAVVNAILDIDFSVYGDGKQLADFIHVNDLAAAAIIFTRADSLDKPVRMLDIGTGQAISVIDLVLMIKERLNSSSKIQFLPMRAGEKPNTRINASSTDLEEAAKYGWECTHTLEDTIEDYVQYYLSDEIDYTYIFNMLVYFQVTYGSFTVDGKVIDLFDLGPQWISDKFNQKK